jgi:chemotaxis family two-component system response regulator Rcp1
VAESGSNPDQDKDRLSTSPSPPEVSSGSKARVILVVEDNRADVFLIRESIAAACTGVTLFVVQDGEKAIRFFEEADRDASAPCPDVVILDINLPRKSGAEVLSQMRLSRRCAHVPILIVTSSDSEKDRETMALLGVNGYFRKPSVYEEFMKLGGLVKGMLENSRERD